MKRVHAPQSTVILSQIGLLESGSASPHAAMSAFVAAGQASQEGHVILSPTIPGSRTPTVRVRIHPGLSLQPRRISAVRARYSNLAAEILRSSPNRSTAHLAPSAGHESAPYEGFRTTCVRLLLRTSYVAPPVPLPPSTSGPHPLPSRWSAEVIPNNQTAPICGHLRSSAWKRLNQNTFKSKTIENSGPPPTPPQPQTQRFLESNQALSPHQSSALTSDL